MYVFDNQAIYPDVDIVQSILYCLWKESYCRPHNHKLDCPDIRKPYNLLIVFSATLGVRARRMLLLRDTSTLSQEEKWLKSAYKNIVANLMDLSLDESSSFDPFSSRFMGIDLGKKGGEEYRSFMEVSSYFWASKGGRGALLEKVIASAGGPNAENGIALSNIPSWIAKAKGSEEVREWHTTGSVLKIKFDLANVLNERVVLLEIKNRVDSGGTAAREEALAKKFLALCKLIQDEHKVFVGDGVEMDVAQTLLGLGIKRIEMHSGFLYNTKAGEATIDSDRTKGFFTQSRRLLADYYQKNNHRFTVKLTYDDKLQKLSFEKDGLEVCVDLLYGSNVTANFTPDRANLDKVLGKVFARTWEDVRLSIDVAISQRILLLKCGRNYLMEIKRHADDKAAASEFSANFRKFLANPDDITSLDECVRILIEKVALDKIPFHPSAEAESLGEMLGNCLYAYAAYKKS